MKKKSRTIETICDKENFQVYLQNQVYCSIGLYRKINCEYHAKEKDYNGLYRCLKYELKLLVKTIH